MPEQLERITLFCDGLGATQRISFVNPLAGHMSLELVETSKAAAWLQKPPSVLPDAIIVSRVTDSAGEQVASWARKVGVPTVYHIDDDLIEVPKSLGESKYLHYSAPERVAQLRRNMEATDLIYASTQALGARLVEHGVSIPVYFGNLYCSVEPESVVAPRYSTGPVFGYMGTGGHGEDLDEIVPAIETVMNAFPSAQFEVFGTLPLPQRLFPYGSRVRHHPGIGEYGKFLTRLHSLGWWCGLAPLSDNPFNRCKADTKWVEYSIAGCAVVAANLPVYHRACAGGAGILAESPDEWVRSILLLLGDPLVRQDMNSAARRKLANEYRHEMLRLQVMEVLKQARAIRSHKSK